MKTPFKNITKKALLALVVLSAPALVKAQLPHIYNIRPYDKSGINVFEASKDSVTEFEGIKVKVGAGFNQALQGLKHETSNTAGTKLYGLTTGFNTASANLYLDAQLADGIVLNLTTYLSSRHHNETWVKGGYIQFDKLPFKGQFWEDLMKFTTIKVGHMEINFGDAHFRRSDNGMTFQNPFAEGYILSSFTTEIGGEVYMRKNDFFGMVGLTNGMLKGNVDKQVPTAADSNIHKSPSIYFKGGYDKQLNDLVRVRLAGSYYHNSSSGSNTLYNGDRGGSQYFMVMEPSTGTYDENAFSGRLNPGFTKKIDAVQLNGLLKVSGFELFGTYELAKGRTKNETSTRDVNQYAIDGIYRFGKDENLFVGARYNTVSAELVGITDKVHIDRTAFSAGWFITNNILLKGEYVNQKYKDYPASNLLNGGKFHGYIVQAAVAF